MDVSLENILENNIWTERDEELIIAPFTYLKNNHGKQLRSLLIKLFNHRLRVNDDVIGKISDVIEMLHTASLLIDDIEDNSNLRRGLPTAHLIYGTSLTINSSNYVYFKALAQVLKLNSDYSGIMEVFNTELLNLHRGQSLDLYWRESLTIPDEEQYFKMVVNKTGGLFRLAIESMMLCSEVELVEKEREILINFTNLLGIIYQIKDDYLNLKSPLLEKNKGFCEDISEGKFSFPIIHSLHHGNKQLLLGLLRQRTQDEKVKQLALDVIEKTDSFEYTRSVLLKLKKKLLQLLEQLKHISAATFKDYETFEGIVENFCAVD